MVSEISAEDFYQKVEKEHLALIDVREQDEFECGHVAGAQNLPLSTLPEHYQILDKKQHYYVICKMGGRSARACDFLTSKGYQVTNVQGGVDAYRGELVE
ncbi:rhodanese-like domain-containing protein [Streptococcus massiliensis]|uniref:Rhodanese-like domain-containing protein n=1 Tax=Streptococcus massiliensis TaxID=313439 RepID=A0A380KXF8_9STRE|nr:rhodanese-like domain-containing protein [Streptococcus massiliensis]SUN75797.1 rhodanese-like domain-containing protein [Streptococcus massiliensis]